MAKPKKQEITLDLITRAKEGDESARNKLAAWIREFVRNQTKESPSQTRDKPSDISQEATLRVIDGLASFEGHSVEDFTNWVAKIAMNQKRLSIRRDNRKKRSLKEDVHDDILTKDSPKVTSHSKTFENRELAERAMALLWDRNNFTDEAREILVYRIFGEIPVAKIAKRHGTTVAQVDSAFRRNLARLLELLQNEECANASRKTPSPEQDRLAKLGLAYLRACESGNGPRIDAFLANVGHLDDETLQTLELFREFRNLAFGPDNEE